MRGASAMNVPKVHSDRLLTVSASNHDIISVARPPGAFNENYLSLKAQLEAWGESYGVLMAFPTDENQVVESLLLAVGPTIV